MTFRAKVLARTKKYDGQTDGHSKPIGPQPFGLRPNEKLFGPQILGRATDFWKPGDPMAAGFQILKSYHVK